MKKKGGRKVYRGSSGGEGGAGGKLGMVWGVQKSLLKIGSLIYAKLNYYKLEASGLCEITQSLLGEVVVNVWRRT